MIDLKAIETEVQHARLARIEAENASIDLEGAIRQVQHFVPGRSRLCFFIAGPDAEEGPPAVLAN